MEVETLASNLDPATVMEAIVDSAVKLTGAGRAAVFEMDEGAKCLRVRAIRGDIDPGVVVLLDQGREKRHGTPPGRRHVVGHNGGDGMVSVWDEIEQTLVNLYSLPHNRIELQRRNRTPQAEAKAKVEEARSGLAWVTREDYSGPRLFLRVVGPGNRAYSGEWWFDASLLDSLHTASSRIYFSAADKKRALRDMLRELLAISNEWNRITEVWVLEVPAGQAIRGYAGPGNPQKLFANLPLTTEGNRMLVGKARQVFFPVKNPFWVKQFQSLAS
jgi:hypothetical protein